MTWSRTGHLVGDLVQKHASEIDQRVAQMDLATKVVEINEVSSEGFFSFGKESQFVCIPMGVYFIKSGRLSLLCF